jgi:hypothetical protein
MGMAVGELDWLVAGLVGLLADISWWEFPLATITPPVKPAKASKKRRLAILRFTRNLQISESGSWNEHRF